MQSQPIKRHADGSIDYGHYARHAARLRAGAMADTGRRLTGRRRWWAVLFLCLAVALAVLVQSRQPVPRPAIPPALAAR